MKRFLPKVAGVLLTLNAAMALINPGFTPVNLVEQSTQIVAVKFGPVGSKDTVSCKIAKVFKGKAKKTTISIDLSTAANSSHTKSMKELITKSEGPGILLVGKFLDTADGEPIMKGFLHVSGKWIVLSGNNDRWNASTISTHMQGTWAGSTEMLAKAIDYVLTDEDPIIPVKSEVSWEEPVKVATVAGKASRARPVDVDGNGKLHLFVPSTDGDRLFLHDGKSFQDVTAKRSLTSKSTLCAWVDLNGDGRLDLISADAKGASSYEQNADGSFAAANALPGAHGRITGIFGLASDAPGKTALLLATDQGAVVYTGKLPLAGKPLSRPRMALGKAGPALFADFDNDRIPDLLQLFEKKSLFYKGKGKGTFAGAVVCNVAAGSGISTAALGDYDADGLLDVFTSAENGNQIWQNAGACKFAPSIHLSGEIDYIAQKGGVDSMTCDVNNDGRQDILITYSERSPHIFFNRGFRSFGHAHMLDLAEKMLLPGSTNGLQTACIADFNDDGAQDFVTVLKNGEVWFFKRESEGEDSLAIKVDLPTKGRAGPLSVAAWVESGDQLRCLGTWNVVPGTGQAFIGRPEPGPCVIKWQVPGAKEQTKTVELEDKPIRLLVK